MVCSWRLVAFAISTDSGLLAEWCKVTQTCGVLLRQTHVVRQDLWRTCDAWRGINRIQWTVRGSACRAASAKLCGLCWSSFHQEMQLRTSPGVLAGSNPFCWFVLIQLRPGCLLTLQKYSAIHEWNDIHELFYFVCFCFLYYLVIFCFAFLKFIL